jgi:uncharacterized protein (TIGR00369 family)
LKKYLPGYPGCFVCGKSNEIGLRSRFYIKDDLPINEEGVEVAADITFTKEYEGFKGVVHGGVITALIDEAMGWSSTVKTKLLYVTVNLNVNFIKPVRVGEKLIFKAKMIEDKKRVSLNEGVVVNTKGEILVKASGKFFAMTEEETKRVIGYLSFEDDTHDIFNRYKAE